MTGRRTGARSRIARIALPATLGLAPRVWHAAAMSIEIPEKLAKDHGGVSADEIGRKWAETMEVCGGLDGDQSVLDIGCGPGRMAISIGERFDWSNRYLGFDVRARDITWATREITGRHPSFGFEHIDVRNPLYNPEGAVDPCEVRFPGEAFDFALATSVFTHMQRDETAHYIRETGRVVSGVFLSSWFLIDDEAEAQIAGGHALFTFAHALDDGTRADRAMAAETVAHPLESAVEMLKAAGFSDIEHIRGRWTRIRTGRHNQDILVARKR